MKFLLTCGGSGGHINPGLSVAEVLRKRGHEVLFVGAPQGLEKKLVPREGFEIRFVDVKSLSHKITPKAMVHNVKVMAGLVGSLREAKKIVRDFAPDAALGTGGYASYPALRAAANLGVPTAVHESNAVPGVTTKMLAPGANLVLVGMESAKSAYPVKEQGKISVVGTPVRGEFGNVNRLLAREKLRLDNRPLVVSMFGSQGARDMNRLMLKLMLLEREGDGWQHIHATGSAAYGWMQEEAAEMGLDFAGSPALRLTEYIYDMPDVLAAADLVICRAGASTLAELMVAGCPAVLIPSPNVTADHQSSNAAALEAAGGAVMLPEAGLDAEGLFTEVKALLEDIGRRNAMRDALLRAAVPDSAERIADALEALARQHRS